jgi:hypothetical protein
MKNESLKRHEPIWPYLVFPGVGMSLGWAFRGFIGGGPLGAMIPGTMVALSLCWLLGRWSGSGVGLIAAFGAVGVGFGGQMTYGQTVGLAVDPATASWGLLGLAVKGAAWGFSGGAVLGLAFTISRCRPGRALWGFVLMVAGTWLGWCAVNAPKLVYFSNRLDRPREEVWAGLFLGALALLLVCALGPLNRVMWRFARYGLVGGWFGFGLGGVVISLGRNSSLDDAFWPWWKGMEYTFGLLFGVALGYAVWRERETLRMTSGYAVIRPQARFSGAGVLLVLVILGLVTADFNFGYVSFSRFDYTIAGAVFLALALFHEVVAWHIAITMTSLAFLFDLGEAAAQEWKVMSLEASMAIAVLLTIPVWWLVEKVRQSEERAVPDGLHLISWAAFAVTTAKTAGQTFLMGHDAVEYVLFVVMTLLLWWIGAWMHKNWTAGSTSASQAASGLPTQS